jgi:hypothetical protein
MVPLGAILVYALWARRASLGEAVTTAAAAIVPLVPEGRVLLTRLTAAVAALRMARRGALAQQLNAIESLASTQVVCLDKTGTLTEAGRGPRARRGGRHAPAGAGTVRGQLPKPERHEVEAVLLDLAAWDTALHKAGVAGSSPAPPTTKDSRFSGISEVAERTGAGGGS